MMIDLHGTRPLIICQIVDDYLKADKAGDTEAMGDAFCRMKVLATHYNHHTWKYPEMEYLPEGSVIPL